MDYPREFHPQLDTDHCPRCGRKLKMADRLQFNDGLRSWTVRRYEQCDCGEINGE